MVLCYTPQRLLLPINFNISRANVKFIFKPYIILFILTFLFIYILNINKNFTLIC